METDLITIVGTLIKNYWYIVLIMFIVCVEVIYYFLIKSERGCGVILDWDIVVRNKMLSIMGSFAIFAIFGLIIMLLDLFIKLGATLFYIVLFIIGFWIYLILNKMWAKHIMNKK